MTENNLNKQVEQIYEVYHKNLESLFPFLEKDKETILKSIDEINRYIEEKQIRDYPADSYSKLNNVKNKRGNIIYTFYDYPGSDSDSAKAGNYSPSKSKIKIVPRLKLVNKEAQN